MTFSGDLHAIGIADVFQNISGNRATGTLHVQWRGGEHFVRFEDGRVAGYSIGRGKGLPLLAHVHQRQYIEPKKLEAFVKKHRRSRKPAGRLLVECRLLSADEVAGILTEMVEECIYDLVGIADARFSFTEGDPPPRVFDPDQRDAAIRLDIGPLMIEGARRGDEWQRIRKTVSGNGDVFVALEGWEEYAEDDLTYHVGSSLDGRTTVARLIQSIPESKFHVLKALGELVRSGVARRCTADEVQAWAEEEALGGDVDDAIELLTQALSVERSNASMRRQLGDLLEQAGRNEDAAAEYAQLGFAAAEAGDLEEARDCYDRAVALHPRDPALHARRAELCRELGDREAEVGALLEESRLLQEMGLVERGVGRLQEAMELGEHPDLVARIAELEADQGHGGEAAAWYVRRASAEEDPDEALVWLRAALAADPGDAALATQVHDLESGRAEQRRRRRRRWVAAGTVVSVVFAFVVTGAIDLVVAHRTGAAVERALAREDGTLDSLRALIELHESYPVLPSGGRAGRMVGRLTDLELREIGRLLESEEPERAAARLEALEGAVARRDLRARCAAMRERIEAENRAAILLARVIAQGDNDPAAAGELAAMSGDVHLQFLLRRLPRTSHSLARQALLAALKELDHPGSLAQVARTYLDLGSDEEEAMELSLQILEGAGRHRTTGSESAWEAVYPELEEAARGQDVRRSERARTALKFLRGWVESPDENR